MIWYLFCRIVAKSLWIHSDSNYSTRKANQHFGLGCINFGLHAALVIGALVYNSSIDDLGKELLLFAILIVSELDFLASSFRAVGDYGDENGLLEKARLLAKDRSLNADWRARAKTVYALTRKIDQKEKRYGQYTEISAAKVELNKAIDCIVRYNMMIHNTHVEIIQQDVDSILSAYAEL